MSYLQRTSTGLNDITWGNLPSNIFTIPRGTYDIQKDTTIAELYNELTDRQIFTIISGIPITFSFTNGVIPSWGRGLIIQFIKYPNATPNPYYFSAIISDDDSMNVGIAYLSSTDGTALMYDTQYKRLV